MNSIDAYAYLYNISLSMDDLVSKKDIETVLDEIKYLFEAIPPDMQDNAESLIEILRKKLADAS